jgi:hypothetical protein
VNSFASSMVIPVSSVMEGSVSQFEKVVAVPASVYSLRMKATRTREESAPN